MRKISLLIAVFAIVFVLIAGCASMQRTTGEVEKPYRTVINARTGVIYNIPAEFPNPFDAEEMKGYQGMQIPITGGFVIVRFNKVDENGEPIGPTYGLVIDPYTQALMAAIVRDKDNHTWRYWIYPEDVPIPCTREEQDAFIQERAYL